MSALYELNVLARRWTKLGQCMIMWAGLSGSSLQNLQVSSPAPSVMLACRLRKSCPVRARTRVLRLFFDCFISSADFPGFRSGKKIAVCRASLLWFHLSAQFD